ncbi:superoxide dismutase [Hyphomonas adhaerens MHS-3]|uniref:Superoxide dismutase [Cu-Zn] n=1 Tax=Hyphomonas adhaerens MHS-3 TaxID=1280949 RepID=A0A069E9C7_9PROT|nr:superoxide dismutase family protein [Hyphomonas adhaerens]KCZ85651.1 superoxide dismutase [Hyphomonas adhaerens MHS-3]
MISRIALLGSAIALGACASVAQATPQDAGNETPPATTEDAAPAMPMDMMDHEGMTEDMPGPDEGVFPSMGHGTADMIGLEGESIGSANLIDGPNGMLIRLELAPGSLEPGWHGIHLHATGDCSDIGMYKMSGGHVGKMEGGHGLLNPKGPENGDLPNIWAAADGSAGYEAFTTLDTLGALVEGDGSAIIIHEGEDDHMTQPIGGAGARVACGVIK